MSWGEVLALAQGEVAKFQGRKCLVTANELHAEAAASPLIAAARLILHIAERPNATMGALVVEASGGPEDEQERMLLFILASCVFGMYGNFLSAAAVQRQITNEAALSEAQSLCLCIANPRRIGIALRSDNISGVGREFLERLNLFLHRGGDDLGASLLPHFETLMRSRAPLADVVFLRCARLALRHVETLAMARLKQGPLAPTFSEFINRILDDGRLCLLPPQYELIATQGFLRSRSNGIVTIPTSTGKTLLGELAIASGMLTNDDVAIYVTPYVALGRQVYECFLRHSPKGVQVCGYFGNFNTSAATIQAGCPTVIVATPERLDAILRTQNLYPKLRTIIFDEAHGIENGVRGARLEGLITRLRLQQERGFSFRIILLSAVLTDVELVRSWLGPNAVHYSDSWRPTARRLAFWASDGTLSWLYGNDPLRPSERGAAQAFGAKLLPWPEFMKPSEHFGVINAQKPSAYANAAYLARHLRATIGGPILVACGTKAATRGVAGAIAEQLEPINPVPEIIQDLVKNILKCYPHLRFLAGMLEKGVAYHNASLPMDVRTRIEDAIKARDLVYIAATTTLAEGVDLPFRVTILFDWLMGFGEEQAPMSSLLFRNIAGRCGRAGEFTEGDTVIFDNVLGEIKFTAPSRRRAAQAQLFSDPPPLRSVIANDNQPVELKQAIRSTIASQLLASVPENPEADSLDVLWAERSYAAHEGRTPLDLTRELRDELLGTEMGEPFAIAASPLRLTPLGAAANRTGFGPTTCRRILDLMSRCDLSFDHAEMASALLLELGASDEQGNYLLRKIARRARTQFYVKAEDLRFLAQGWLDGVPLTDLFVNLPKAKASRAAVHPQKWVNGESDYEAIAAQYDKFVDLVEYSFGGFLPWVLRAFAALAPFASTKAGMRDWSGLATLFENSRLADLESIDELIADGGRGD